MIFIKKIFLSLALLFFCLFSFYFTNQYALYIKNKNPLMQEIKSKQEEMSILPVNSTIIDNIYIIPGISGREINVDSSFFNMQKNNTYDENKFVFNFIKPEISLEENKDKIIIRGNSINNIDSFLSKHRANNYLCFVKNNKIPPLCKDKFLITPSLTITHSNINKEKSKIRSGEIILIKESVTLTDLISLLNEIKYRDLSIKPLSFLIKE